MAPLRVVFVADDPLAYEHLVRDTGVEPTFVTSDRVAQQVLRAGRYDAVVVLDRPCTLAELQIAIEAAVAARCS